MILTNFIKGLKKSFDGKDYLREVGKCKCWCGCDELAFSTWCQTCQVYHFKHK